MRSIHQIFTCLDREQSEFRVRGPYVLEGPGRWVPASLLCVDTNTTTATKCANTFVRVNQYPWKSNLPEISRPDGAAGFFLQPDGATDTPELTIALTRLVGARFFFHFF